MTRSKLATYIFVICLVPLTETSGRVLYQAPSSTLSAPPAEAAPDIAAPPGCNCTDVPPPGISRCVDLDVTQRCSTAATAMNFCEISCARCLCCLSIAATAENAGLTTFTKALHSLLIAAEEKGYTGLVPPSLWSAFVQPGANKTVFVPNNYAFDALAASLGMNLTSLLQDTDLLNQVLQYSVLAGSIVTSAEEMAAGQLGSIIRTQLIPLTLGIIPNGNGPLMLQGMGSNATVVQPNMAACQSILHVVNNVLLPFVNGARGSG